MMLLILSMKLFVRGTEIKGLGFPSPFCLVFYLFLFSYS